MIEIHIYKTFNVRSGLPEVARVFLRLGISLGGLYNSVDILLDTQIDTGFSSQSWKMKVLKQKMPIYDERLTDIIVIVYKQQRSQ